MENYYNKPIPDTINALHTDSKTGLSADEARKRLHQYGHNKLKEEGQKNPFIIILDQLKEMMVIILIIAACISFFLHEPIDGIVILVIVVLNTVIGFYQEFKAEKAMAALKALTVPEVRVKRDGQEQKISSHSLVPGDLVIIEAGNIIPADARLTMASNLKVQEAALTGESEPVEKDTDTITGADVQVGDRKNMLHMGTVVTYGRGEAIITATGMQTELGKIADMLQSVVDEKTPLQKRLDKLGKMLAIAALFLIIIVACISFFRGYHLTETFMTAISMAVAAIPEGLPAVVTIALAVGAKKLLRKKSLIRHLPAVETLGSVTYICSDKTGTLTRNKMTVTTLIVPGNTITVDDLKKDTGRITNDMRLMLAGGALCNDAVIEVNDETGDFETIGDPTEGALVDVTGHLYIPKSDLETSMPRIDEFPFDSERKRMSTVHDPAQITDSTLKKIISDIGVKDNQLIVFTKGSIDGMMTITDRAVINGKIVSLTDEIKNEALSVNESMANNGIRVLGVALRIIDTVDKSHKYEENLVYIGMMGMIDPIRPEAKQAVAECIQAGIKPVMITGDHPLTAVAIAKELGMTTGDTYITGSELAKLTVKELEERVLDNSVYARVSPEHKMKIIDALQDKGQIVSMTGDGVNDAPALKSADIGVAMGITGTDVSKESSDMVLVDDNFATIVNAVKEGRIIYDNIKKFLKYILTGNLGEILVMLIGPLMGMPIPLLPTQILWINLVTDGLPAIALGFEKAEKDIMKRPPFKPDENIFARGVGRQILIMGTLTAVICLVIGMLFYDKNSSSTTWQTMVFSTLTFCQMAFALSVRSNYTSFFRLNPFSNMQLLLSVIITLGLQIMLIYTPFFQMIFKTSALSPNQLGICLGCGIIIIAAVEIEKLITGLRSKAA